MGELYHYNHYHDPANGQFTTSRGGGGGIYVQATGRNGKVTKRDIKRAIKQRKKWSKDYRNLSEEELNERMKRLQLEKQYMDALKNDSVVAGKEYTKKLLQTVGTKAVETAAVKLTGATIDTVYKTINNKQDFKRDVQKARTKILETKALDEVNVKTYRQMNDVGVDTVQRAKESGADKISININGSTISTNSNGGNNDGGGKKKKKPRNKK